MQKVVSQSMPSTDAYSDLACAWHWLEELGLQTVFFSFEKTSQTWRFAPKTSQHNSILSLDVFLQQILQMFMSKKYWWQAFGEGAGEPLFLRRGQSPVRTAILVTIQMRWFVQS